MTRFALVAVLMAACWSSANKTTEPGKTDQLQADLAARDEEIATLKRRLKEVTAERDEAVAYRNDLQTRLREIDARLANVAAPPPSPTPAPPPRRYGPDPAKTYAVTLAGWPQRGPADAKVTLVFVHDYTCPYCERSRATLDDLQKKYGKDLRIVYRPILIRPKQSQASALAACAAGRQNKYDALEPLLWDKGFKAQNYDTDVTLPDGSTQRCWDALGGCPILIGFAQEAGLDIRRFRSDMQSCDATLQQSVSEMSALTVASTPSFFINGRYMSGMQQIDPFVALIDEEKRKADERIRKGTPKARYYQEWVISRGETKATP
jgi:protein-disulfide isomerase